MQLKNILLSTCFSSALAVFGLGEDSNATIYNAFGTAHGSIDVMQQHAVTVCKNGSLVQAAKKLGCSSTISAVIKKAIDVFSGSANLSGSSKKTRLHLQTRSTSFIR